MGIKPLTELLEAIDTYHTVPHSQSWGEFKNLFAAIGRYQDWQYPDLPPDGRRLLMGSRFEWVSNRVTHGDIAEELKGRAGQSCRVILRADDKMLLIEFESDGFLVVAPRRAVRRMEYEGWDLRPRLDQRAS
jgi:hypothetical protein